jgi:hypothetical protein
MRDLVSGVLVSPDVSILGIGPCEIVAWLLESVGKWCNHSSGLQGWIGVLLCCWKVVEVEG